MRYTSTFVLFSSVLVLGSVAGCGGDETTDIPGNDASIDNATGNDASTNNDGSLPPPGDGGSNDGASTTDGPVSTGDGGSTPGIIQCGNTTCNAPAQACCIRFQADGGADGGAGVARFCAAPNNCQNGVTNECDEKADCPPNQVCCAELGGGGVRGQCQNGCGQGVQLCKTTPECTNDGGVCTVYTCPGNTIVQSCRKPFQQCN